MVRASCLVAAFVLFAGCPSGGDIDDDAVADDDSGDDDSGDDDSGDDDASGTDADGDGSTLEEGDCDDTDPAIHPGASEITCDQVDNDCDPTTSDSPDVDGDLYDVCVDCDDSDPSVHPAAPGEIACDGVDTDCGVLTPDLDRNVPAEYISIQDAIDASEDGDAVCVAPGFWNGPLDFGGKSLQLIGTGGPDVTVIDGQQLGSVVTVNLDDGSESALQGLTLTGGLAENGGGVHAWGGSTVLSNVVISECVASERGGGVYVRDATASLSNVVLEDCSATVGGGLAAFGGNVEIIHGIVARNSAEEGGGIWADYYSTATIQNASIYQNDALAGGGGVFVGMATSLDLHNGSLINNTAGDGAGVMEGLNSYYAHVTSTQLWGNVAGSGHGALNLDEDGYGMVMYNNFYLNFPDHCSGCETWLNMTAQPDFLDIDPIDDMRGWDQHLAADSSQVDAGYYMWNDPDGSHADIGIYSGSGAGDWDLDGDGYPCWWLPGPYDPATSPGADCDDEDPSVYPGAGC